MRIRRMMLSLTALTLVGVACDGGKDADVKVTMRDDGIKTSIDVVPAGELTFKGVNEGTEIHEFEVFGVPEGVDANALPVEGDTAPADEMLVIIDEVEDIAPGTSTFLNLTLDPGNYAVICNLPGHYANGMHTTFTVE